MELTFDNVYEYLEERKHNLNFIRRTDVVIEDFGTCNFCTLFCNKERDDIPDVLKDFLIKAFNITEKDYDFIQVQKYEIGEYILPHKDPYPCFGLVMLSTSDKDGLVVEQLDNTYKFYPDKAGTIIDIPKFTWHWVNPVRDKTRYSAVYGLHTLPHLNKLDDIIDI